MALENSKKDRIFAGFKTSLELGSLAASIVAVFFAYSAGRSAQRATELAQTSLQVNTAPRLLPTSPEPPTDNMRQELLEEDCEIFSENPLFRLYECGDYERFAAHLKMVNAGAGVAAVEGWTFSADVPLEDATTVAPSDLVVLSEGDTQMLLWDSNSFYPDWIFYGTSVHIRVLYSGTHGRESYYTEISWGQDEEVQGEGCVSVVAITPPQGKPDKVAETRILDQVGYTAVGRGNIYGCGADGFALPTPG